VAVWGLLLQGGSGGPSSISCAVPHPEGLATHGPLLLRSWRTVSNFPGAVHGILRQFLWFPQPTLNIVDYVGGTWQGR